MGHAIGGNFDTFKCLIGTPHMPETRGAILFVEDTHISPDNLSREFLQLKLSGHLEQLAGIVIGEFIDVPKSKGPRDPSIDDVIEEYLRNLGIPCVYGYSFSHGPYTIPIPIGAMTMLDADTGEISFQFNMG